MKRLLRELVKGEGLRHSPVGLAAADQRPVCAIAKSASSERDVSSMLFPLSLSPLVLGFARRNNEPASEVCELRMQDESKELRGSIR